MFRIPSDLLEMPDRHQSIQLEGCTIVESCHHEQIVEDSIYVDKRVLICILSGKIEVELDDSKLVIEKGEIGLLNKNIYAPYRKFGSSADGYSSVLFFLEDDFIYRFLETRKLVTNEVRTDCAQFLTRPSLQLHDFIKSVLNLFSTNLKYDEDLLQIKVKELLIYLTQQYPEIIGLLLNGNNAQKKDLVEVMENNYLKYASLEEFAFMSGRSLATFKRDFKDVFNTTPAKWLKSKRMDHAKYLLQHTGSNVSEVYNKVGFMNYTHFSRSFKEHFGYGPGSLK